MVWKKLLVLVAFTRWIRIWSSSNCVIHGYDLPDKFIFDQVQTVYSCTIHSWLRSCTKCICDFGVNFMEIDYGLCKNLWTFSSEFIQVRPFRLCIVYINNIYNVNNLHWALLHSMSFNTLWCQFLWPCSNCKVTLTTASEKGSNRVELYDWYIMIVNVDIAYGNFSVYIYTREQWAFLKKCWCFKAITLLALCLFPCELEHESETMNKGSRKNWFVNENLFFCSERFGLV